MGKKIDSPVPLPDFLNLEKKFTPKEKNRPRDKHDKSYIAFCKWASRPRDLRKPRTQMEFEKLWKLPIGYTTRWKDKEDFQARRLKYFWNWMFDRFPDVMYGVYTRAVGKSSADAKIFAEFVGKKLEQNKPKTRMTPFMLVGVPQEKLSGLFTPPKIEEAIEKTVEMAKAQDAEVVK